MEISGRWVTEKKEISAIGPKCYLTESLAFYFSWSESEVCLYIPKDFPNGHKILGRIQSRVARKEVRDGPRLAGSGPATFHFIQITPFLKISQEFSSHSFLLGILVHMTFSRL